MVKKDMKKFKYIDLFAGIGGFHQAMSQLGGECVFASEIDPWAIETYMQNYGIDSNLDITLVNEHEIPDHDVLCAGFPCQAFSKAGKQLGFRDETKGTLFFDIERILLAKKPKYIILENVRNLVSHDGGHTWKIIKEHLQSAGYRLTEKPLILSPHHFGIPQLRERVVILGVFDPQNIYTPLNITFDDLKHKNDNKIDNFLEDTNNPIYNISSYEENVLKAWDEFYKNIDIKVIGFPIWIDFFTQNQSDNFPQWKNEFIKKNNELYKRNREFIDLWLEKNNVSDWVPTHRKFEWQSGEQIRSLWEGIIQFRPSGIRVKTPTTFPALVAMVHIPIIGKYKRRLTVREAAKLQSFPHDFIHNSNLQQAYKQFGNAVNVDVIKQCAIKLFMNYNMNDIVR
jgi:DNA (cytosine-5)-methyltransferase 1